MLVLAHKKSTVTLPADILIDILELTSPATLHFSCRLVSKMVRGWSEHVLRKKLKPKHVIASPYDGKSRQSCSLKTAPRIVIGKKARPFRNSITDTPNAHVAFDRELTQLIFPKTVCPSLRLPWQCRVVVLRVSAKCELRDLWGRGVAFCSDGTDSLNHQLEISLESEFYGANHLSLSCWVCGSKSFAYIREKDR